MSLLTPHYGPWWEKVVPFAPAAGAVLEADSDAAYDAIKRRWKALIDWDVEHKAPETAPAAAWWRNFSAQWEGGSPDRDALSRASGELQVAEGNAQLKGFVSPDVPPVDPSAWQAGHGAPAAPRVATPSPEAEHAAAAAVDKASREAEKKIKDEIPRPDPLLVPKAVGVGAVALGTVLGAATARSDAARAGIAVGGALLTAAVGWLAFAPKKEAPK